MCCLFELKFLVILSKLIICLFRPGGYTRKESVLFQSCIGVSQPIIIIGTSEVLSGSTDNFLAT